MRGGGALCWRLLKKPVVDGGEGAARFPLPFTAGSSSVALLLFVVVLYEAVGVAAAAVVDLWLLSAAWALPSLVAPAGPGKGRGKEGAVDGLWKPWSRPGEKYRKDS